MDYSSQDSNPIDFSKSSKDLSRQQLNQNMVNGTPAEDKNTERNRAINRSHVNITVLLFELYLIR